MKASPPAMLEISSGMLYTFADVGMVFSFAVAILTASRSITRSLAFATFVGTTSPHRHLAVAFTTGLHAAFYALMAFMILAAAHGQPALTTEPIGQPRADVIGHGKTSLFGRGGLEPIVGSGEV